MIRTEIQFQEWRDENARRNFPFSDISTLTNTVDTISHSMFIDARFYCISENTIIYLDTVDVNQTTLEFIIKDDKGEIICSGIYDKNASQEEIILLDANNRNIGMLICDPTEIETLFGWGLGEHKFTEDQTSFMPMVCIPAPEIGIRGFLLEDGTLVTGDVKIFGDNGVIVNYINDELRIDFLGDPEAKKVECEQLGLFTAHPFLETINNCPPDSLGNFSVVAGMNVSDDNILRINRETGTITLSMIGTNNV